MAENWLGIIICSVCISALLTVVIIPQILNVAFKKKLFDNPNFRKVHKGVVPRLGGFAFLPVVSFTLFMMAGFCTAWCDNLEIGDVKGYVEVAVLLASMTLLYLIGLKDDLVDVKYNAKFIVQGVCALLTVLSGAYIMNFDGLLWIYGLNQPSACLLTAFLIVFIINAVNLIDGIDGLASGIGLITMIFFGSIFYFEGEYLFSLVSWVMFGTVFIFFLFNYFGNNRNKRKIFMGDTGALTMGMVVAFLTIEMSVSPIEEPGGEYNAILVAFSPLVIPLFDAIRVFIYRIVKGRSPFLPDKCHIHHKLMEAGLNSRQTLFIILALQILLIFINLWLSGYLNINLIVCIDVVVYLLVITSVTMKSNRREAGSRTK